MSKRIETLEGLRFVLFVTIFLFHCEMFIGDKLIYKTLLIGGGTLPVSMFFVLSGFVLGVSNKNIYDFNMKSTYSRIKRKFRKIYPLHILLLFSSLPLFFLIKDRGATIKNIAVLCIDTFLLQSWVPIRSVWLSFNGVTWYLSTLLFLTLCDPILLRINQYVSKKNIEIYIVYLVCIIAVFLAIIVKVNPEYYLYAFPPARLLDYIAGFFTAKLLMRKKTECVSCNKRIMYKFRNNMKEIFLVILYVFLLYSYNYVSIGLRRAAIYLPYACLAIYILAKEKGCISFILNKISKLGKYTLTFYLSHQLILLYIFEFKKNFKIVLPEVFFITIAFIITLLVGIILEKLYLFFKKERSADVEKI